MDRVELAFRKFDLNHDGFLSREEFDMVSIKLHILVNFRNYSFVDMALGISSR